MKLKLFTNIMEPGMGCRGGIILVAAHSKEEAHEVFSKDENLNGLYVTRADIDRDFYYYPDAWKELSMLAADVDEPQIIIDGCCFV